MEQHVENVLALYEQRRISRRGVVQALAAIALGMRSAAQSNNGSPSAPILHARTLNHLSIYTPDVPRSKAFYQRLTGLPVRDEGADFCELRLEGTFLGIYAPDARQRAGIDHFCMGIDGYHAERVFDKLKHFIPEAHPTLEYGDQVYVRDPDGVRVQFADSKYKL